MQRGKISTDIETSESCTKNAFLLKRLSIASNSPSVQVNFSPIPKQNSSAGPQSHQTQFSQSFPVFNFDSCYYTPSFVLDVDKQKYVANSLTYLNLHNQKGQQLCNQKQQLFVPKPSKSNSFCCICKTAFDDYLTHVNIPKHQELMRSSEFNQSIQEFCRVFNSEQVEEQPKGNKIRAKKKIEKAEKNKRKGKKEINILLLSTNTNLDYSLSIRKEIVV